ncbi:MAG: hypothetical protein WCF30_11240 [Terracidiphilus sp.]
MIQRRIEAQVAPRLAQEFQTARREVTELGGPEGRCAIMGSVAGALIGMRPIDDRCAVLY